MVNYFEQAGHFTSETKARLAIAQLQEARTESTYSWDLMLFFASTTMQLRTGSDARMLPTVPALNAVKRSTADATASFLHDTFFHRGAEKIYRALGSTKGYIQTRLPDHH